MTTITVLDEHRQYNIVCNHNQSIMSVLVNHDSQISAYCGGKGRCGKCKIRLLKGDLPVTAEDRRFFTKEELADGYRLACTAYPTSDCTIRLCMENEQEMEVVVDTFDKLPKTNKMQNKTYNDSSEYGIAIDIGTTTIAMQLVEKESREIMSTYTALNLQRSYGADVISRIQAANSGHGKELQEKIAGVLEKGISSLLHDSKIDACQVREMVISANTTMIHLLLGYPCETLGVSPFKPYEIAPGIINSQEIFGNCNINCDVKIMPGFSTFVGGDIVSGLYHCNIMDSEKTVLFVDLGTNGEMVLGNKDKLLVTSVAAGPAFEGGNISCGIGSIPGAICGVEMEHSKITKVRTIGDKEPIGLCGTGVIEAIYELIKEKIVDETGLLDEEWFETGLVFEGTTSMENGPLTLTQKDIREIQLAKSAVRSGIEVLMKRYGIEYEEIGEVYLAGGFGYLVNIDKMVGIGMMPAELKEKIKAVGNASLAGAREILFQEDRWKSLDKITFIGKEINLAMDAEFQSLYMENIYFPKSINII